MKTNKMKKVLIAMDYDPTAQKVAEAGFSIAKSLNAEVILLHVIRDPVFYTTREFSPIMGYNGYMDVSQKWLENIVMGSVTEKVMKHSSIPLFIIPTRKQN